MKLIINADDFGITSGVTYGIYDAIKNGVVTSTTMMVNTQASSLAAKLIKENLEMAVGLHFNISIGYPLTSGKTLLINDKLIRPKDLPENYFYDEDELYLELEAQYNRFINLVGRKPTHIDSHLYIHQNIPIVKKVVTRFSEIHDLPVRDIITNYQDVYFEGNFKVKQGDNLKSMTHKFIDILDSCDDRDIVELMVHPGYIDYTIEHNSSYNYQRNLECNTLLSKEVKDYIDSKNISLISYRNVVKKSNG